MAIHARAETWGSGSGVVYDCQWPGCRNVAAHRTKRGLDMAWMYVCERHALTMRELPNVEAFAVSRDRQRGRAHIVPRRHVQGSS